MKLWHDDVRPAPHDWVWAQNNDQARALLECLPITIISLDHDLGAEIHVTPDMDISQITLLRGMAEDNGMKLVEWMIEKDLVPRTVIIHSWNIPAAKRMWQALIDNGYAAELEPFTSSLL
jgi:hypothetical protein